MLSELSSIQKFATCSETSEYDKQSTLTWLSPFIFISKKPFSLKVIRIKTKFAEKILFKLLIFLYFKTIYGICRFEKIVRLKIHPVGKNNFNASSKSSTTPYDRWVQAILHKDCRVETRNKNHDEGPHKSPDAAKFHQCWNNWSRWSIIITQPYLFDLAVGSTRTVTLTSLLVNRQTLLGGLRGFGIEVRALNTDVSSGAP